jgi:Streptomycin adenylyltransferase
MKLSSSKRLKHMTHPTTRSTFIEHLRTTLAQDPRIVGVIDYGSGSEGHSDQWSDVDVALFIRDADFEAFDFDWRTWAAQFGRLLLAYVGGVGHPWAVYEAAPVPLRVDFAFYPESKLDIVRTLAKSPSSPAAMVWYDGTGGTLTQYATQLVGQSLRPLNEAATFEQVSGDFWYYLLRTWSQFQRGQFWAMRHDFNNIILGNLMALLRMESGATDRWRASSSAAGIEKVVSTERLTRLDSCIPGANVESLMAAMRGAAALGRDVCARIAARHGWTWPDELAQHIEHLLTEANPQR